MAFVVNEMRDLLKIRATTSNKHEIQPEAKEKIKTLLLLKNIENITCNFHRVKYRVNPTAMYNIPHAIISILISSFVFFVSILWMIYPMHMPKMYGDSLVHGLSYRPLKNVRFSSDIKLKMILMLILVMHNFSISFLHFGTNNMLC